ncbi:MAG: VOC family protein [Rhodospirillales bacterium]
MHKSRLAVVVIDCPEENLTAASSFWSAALGRPHKSEASKADPRYSVLDGPPEEMRVLLQSVEHPARVHLDIETDDIEAEARRLEGLGAKRLGPVKRWVVMEAPSGQRFCLVRPQRPDFEEKANRWD